MPERITPIFIFSLPRSGSTLTQWIIGSHDEVMTVSETFLALPFVYSTRDSGIVAEYNHSALHRGVTDVIQAMPGGRKEYLKEMAHTLERIYTRLTPEGKRYFLDKTPRYGLIVRELIEMFPDGRFVFLWRNPLAIISSMMGRNGKWRLHRFEVDLFRVFENLVDASRACGDRACMIRFEDLIDDPQVHFARVFDYIGLTFDPSVLDTYSNAALPGRMGRKMGSAVKPNLDKTPLEKWKRVLNNPIRNKWCRQYLDWIGTDRLGHMGYDLDSLQAELRAVPLSAKLMISDAIRMMRFGRPGPGSRTKPHYC